MPARPVASRRRAATPAAATDAPAAAPALPALVQVKLWENPCGFSFRINFLALNFNLPVYGWIQQRYRLMRPEYVVLYSLHLRDGSSAQEVCESGGFPKNTLSRAIQKLLARRIVSRSRSADDRRRYVLRLTARGREILEQTVPLMVQREQTMLAGLNAAEQRQLSQLLARLVSDFPRWPTRLQAA